MSKFQDHSTVLIDVRQVSARPAAPGRRNRLLPIEVMNMLMPQYLTILGVLLIIPSSVYSIRHPRAKGEPFGKTRLVLLVPLGLSVCALAAAGILFLTVGH